MLIAELSKLSLTVERVPILAEIDLVVKAGETVGIAGPNGAGKTTLLLVLATLTSPSGGDGSVLGARLGSDEVATVRPRIGWSGHEPAVYDDLTLAENLHHIARLSGIEPSRADRALTQVGLAGAARRRASACSNGMRRRADLARLLMTAHALVLLDEAHAGLDAGAAVIVDEICRRTVASEGAVVMVSHDATALSGRVDRVLALEEGHLR
jgi:ABC-type multidrug transport system ATPase subunit